MPAESKAADAAASGTADDPATRAAAYLAAQPTAVWLTPEAQPIETVGAEVTALAAEARDAGRDPRPRRLRPPRPRLRQPVRRRARPGRLRRRGRSRSATPLRAAETPTVVIVEPDAVALAPDCDGMTERFAHIATAVTNLQARTAWLYLDGGPLELAPGVRDGAAHRADRRHAHDPRLRDERVELQRRRRRGDVRPHAVRRARRAARRDRHEPQRRRRERRMVQPRRPARRRAQRRLRRRHRRREPVDQAPRRERRRLQRRAGGRAVVARGGRGADPRRSADAPPQ